MSVYSHEDATSAVALHRKFADLGVPTQARNWLVKALHPPAPTESGAMPDESYAPTVHIDYRPTVVIGPPPGLLTATWDLCIYAPPGDVNAAFYNAGSAGTDFNSLAATPNASGVLALQTETQDISIVATSGDGLGAVEMVNRVPGTIPAGFRSSYRSVTAHLTASSLNDQGTVYAAQIPVGSPTDDLCIQYDSSTMAPHLALVRTVATGVSFDENQLSVMSPRMYVAAAREGAYVPARLTGPSQPFVTRANAYGRVVQLSPPSFPATTAQFAYFLFSEYAVTALPGVVGHNNRFLPRGVSIASGDGGNEGNTRTFLDNGFFQGTFNPDTGYDNVNHTVIIFRGLSPSASVTLRAFVGLEIAPMPYSPLTPFVKLPPGPDEKALAIYYRVAADMASAYPARYNLFGSLLPLIGSAVTALWPSVKAGLAAGLGHAMGSVARQVLAPAPARQVAPASMPPKPRKKKAKVRVAQSASVRSSSRIRRV